MSRKPIKQALVGMAVVTLTYVLLLTGCAPPETVTAPPGGTVPPPAPSPEKVIKDLAYIKVTAWSYSDDADPENEGIEPCIVFYDSKSEPIYFLDIPVVVTIELYGYRDVFDTFDHKKMEFICQTQATIGPSMRLSEWCGEYMRIPFENIPVNRSKYYSLGTIKVIATTPSQGDFEAIDDCVWLYPED